MMRIKSFPVLLLLLLVGNGLLPMPIAAQTTADPALVAMPDLTGLELTSRTPGQSGRVSGLMTNPVFLSVETGLEGPRAFQIQAIAAHQRTTPRSRWITIGTIVGGAGGAVLGYFVSEDDAHFTAVAVTGGIGAAIGAAVGALAGRIRIGPHYPPRDPRLPGLRPTME